MTDLPYPPPKEEYCRICGTQLNPYGYCPNTEQHPKYTPKEKLDIFSKVIWLDKKAKG